jgi:hypothetical protein
VGKTGVAGQQPNLAVLLMLVTRAFRKMVVLVLGNQIHPLPGTRALRPRLRYPFSPVTTWYLHPSSNRPATTPSCEQNPPHKAPLNDPGV